MYAGTNRPPVGRRIENSLVPLKYCCGPFEAEAPCAGADACETVRAHSVRVTRDHEGLAVWDGEVEEGVVLVDGGASPFD